MAENEALRHLEKDMADILEVLTDSKTTEVILNPHKRANGSYVGYILVDQHGSGLQNLLSYTESIIPSHAVNVGDYVVYKRAIQDSKIRFWVKLKRRLDDDLRQIGFCLRNYFTADAIYQEQGFAILEYAEMIEQGNLPGMPILAEQALDFLVELINRHLPPDTEFNLVYTHIVSDDELSRFSPYPEKLVKTERVKMSASRAETIMSVLASINGKFIHQKNPILECQIPKYGCRFTGVIPPVVQFPAFCIRKHSPQIYSLEEFVRDGILQVSSYETILSWIRRKFNILIAGGTGSGKTTLANALLDAIARIFPQTRVLIIEDVPELKFNTSRSVAFTVGEFFSMHDALRTTLRFKPERIVMGEIRGAEAYTLLKAWNTGHPGGVATIHANGVNEALYRFESCVRDHPDVKVNRQEIGFTINGIISIQNVTLREEARGEYVNVVKRKVTALRQIHGYDPDKDIYSDIVYADDLFAESNL